MKNFRRHIKFVPLIALALLYATIGIGMRVAVAVTNDTWVAAANGNWNSASNWSSGVPGSSNVVIFSASSTKNATINAWVNVAGITISSGYTGTISWNSGYSVTVGASGFSQAAGTFSGSASTGDTFTDNGNFSMTGGTFGVPAGGALIYGSAATLSSGIQDTYGGGVGVVGSTVTVTGSSTVQLLALGSSSGSSAITIATGTTLTTGKFYVQTNWSTTQLLGGGTVDVTGNISTAYNPGYATGTVPIVLTGTSTQTIGDDSLIGAGYSNDSVMLPDLTISKSTGSVSLSGTVRISGSFTNTNATTINPGTSTVIFGPDQYLSQIWTTTGTITGSSTFYNLEFGANVYGGESIFTIATGTTLTLQGHLGLDTGYTQIPLLGGGTINVQGNIETSWYPEYATGTVAIVLNGTGTQYVGDGAASFGSVMLPNLTITKTAGSVDFEGLIGIAGNFTNTNGTTINPQTSTVVMGPSQALSMDLPTSTTLITNDTLSGSSTFYNLLFGADTNVYSLTTTMTIPTGTTITTQGYLAFDVNYSAVPLLGGGTIDVMGNIESGYHFQYATGTASVVLTGSSSQIVGDDTLDDDGYPTDNLVLPNLTVSKTTGSVGYMEGPVEIAASTTVNSGEFQLATGTGYTYFKADGTVTVNSGARLADYPTSQSSTLALKSGLVNNGTLFFSGDGNGCALPLPEYIILRNQGGSTAETWSGSGTFIIRYADVSHETTAPTGPYITVVNGTDEGNNNSGGGQWSFNPPTARPELIQSVTSSSTSASSLALPSFGIYPRANDLVLVAVAARSQTITAPTDSASNTYNLVTSTTIGSDKLALYYAKNVNTTSSFAVTAHGTGGGPLSASAFEYTSMDPSSTLDAYVSNVDNSGTATNLTSFPVTGHSLNELYFGIMTLAANTSASGGAGWTTESGVSDNSSHQALYVEDIATTTELNTAATWTAATSTSYGAIAAVFTTPYVNGYVPTGYLDSATFDTGVASGTALNSFTWQGTLPTNTSVGFQFAVSNSPSGPWTYLSPDGTTNAPYFTGLPGTSISLKSTSNGYALFSGYRYFRYRVILSSDPTYSYSPTVSSVSVNWSP